MHAPALIRPGVDRLAMASLAIMLAALPISSRAETQCPTKGNDGNYHSVEEGLNWCSTNHGFNEGCVCGLNALGGCAGKISLPNIAGGACGNVWDRTNMMGATKSAYHAGCREEAITAAVCCQDHNPHMHKCLAENRDAVRVWLQAH